MILQCNSATLRIAPIVVGLSLLLPLGRGAYASPQKSTARAITIPDGTPVHLYLMDDLNSRKAKAGDAIRLKVREGILVGGVDVIATNSPVIGHVVVVGRSGFVGHSGKLGLSVDYAVATDGAKIPLRGEATLKGGSNGAVTAAATAWYGPAALLIRGWEADIHKGTMLNAYVNGDQTITLGSANPEVATAPAPMHAEQGKPSGLRASSNRATPAILPSALDSSGRPSNWKSSLAPSGSRTWWLAYAPAEPASTIGLSSSTIFFPVQEVGTESAPINVIITNNTSAVLTISGLRITGNDSSDFTQSNDCGHPIDAGAACTVSLIFRPTASGTRISVLILDGAAQGTMLSGIGK
jgi:hypothetical protein